MPEVVEDFFLLAGPMLGVHPKEITRGKHCYRVGRVPKNLWTTGDLLEPRFGKLGKEYKQIVFDKRYLSEDPTVDWVTPGHPLFEVVREELLQSSAPDMERGSVFYDVAANRTGAPRRVFGDDPRWPGQHASPATVCG